MKNLIYFFLTSLISLSAWARLVPAQEHDKYLRALDMAIPAIVTCDDRRPYYMHAADFKKFMDLESMEISDNKEQPLLTLKWVNKQDPKNYGLYSYTTDETFKKVEKVTGDFYRIETQNTGTILDPVFEEVSTSLGSITCWL